MRATPFSNLVVRQLHITADPLSWRNRQAQPRTKPLNLMLPSRLSRIVDSPKRNRLKWVPISNSPDISIPKIQFLMQTPHLNFMPILRCHARHGGQNHAVAYPMAMSNERQHGIPLNSANLLSSSWDPWKKAVSVSRSGASLCFHRPGNGALLSPENHSTTRPSRWP